MQQSCAAVWRLVPFNGLKVWFGSGDDFDPHFESARKDNGCRNGDKHVTARQLSWGIAFTDSSIAPSTTVTPNRKSFFK